MQKEKREKGYVSGVTTSLEGLVQVVKKEGSVGIFNLLFPQN